MSELLFIVGNSNSGKDYIANNRFENFTVVKLNYVFKQQFEVDHKLSPGACNDKTRRQEIVVKGPLRGYSIQDAMVLAYQQSLSNVGYGAQFSTSTVLSTLARIAELSQTRTPVAITDLRKPSELRLLIEFAHLINYSLRMIQVVSNQEIQYASDRLLAKNKSLFELLVEKRVEKCCNIY
jgi:energy-coupling factor transporter transmembrane protein EcfT